LLLPSNYYPACSWDSTITITSGGPLQVAGAVASSACSDGTAVVALSITGGSGPGSYTYQLQTLSGGTWTNTGAAQISSIFDGLNKSTQYRIVVTDTCGNSLPYNVSFNSAPIKLTFSTVDQPCANDVFTMTLPTFDGATYSWTADGSPISGATGNSYTVTVPDAGAVTYTGVINIGSCVLISQPYTLNPANCNTQFLPVTGLKLQTPQVNGNNDVQLTWGTTTEINNSSFTVQRSADGGKTWVDIGTVPTKAINGNSSIPLTYTLTDSRISAGSYEYRVKETNIDGSTILSNVAQIKVTTSVTKVYPIPASNYVRISLPEEVNNVSYRVISTDGKIALTGTMSNQGTYGQISVRSLASGVYFLQVTINNAVQTYTIQVQH